MTILKQKSDSDVHLTPWLETLVVQKMPLNQLKARVEFYEACQTV